jgi:predicted lipoprotein with Yx(FWY)xxD motif
LAPDGSNGAIITWQENRSGGTNDIYAQRVYSDGTTAWATNGVSLCAAANNQQHTQITSDGTGGAVVTWEDQRSGGNNDIYAQRVYSDGTTAWATNGVSLCAAANNRHRLQIASDGAGGAIVTWEDYRSINGDIYAQRVYSDGTTAWTTDGVSLSVAADGQAYPQIASDGEGGAIVTWEDYRLGSYSDIYAQRVYSDGTTAWATDGVSLCTAAYDQYDPQIASDGEGGAIITWEDYRSGSHYDIYAQRVYSDGTTAWATDGVSLCVTAGSQDDPQIASDGAGGAIVTWVDYRSSNSDIYAQRVYSDGTAAWITDGISLCAASNQQREARIASDGEGGAIVTWRDHRSGSHEDIYAQRVDQDGNVLWQANGLAASLATGDQLYPGITGDGRGGAILAWEDRRSLTLSGGYIYAQRVGTAEAGSFAPLVMKRE